jgi:hypothetical protein
VKYVRKSDGKRERCSEAPHNLVPLIRPAVKAEPEVNATRVHQNAFFLKISMLFPVAKGRELVRSY